MTKQSLTDLKIRKLTANNDGRYDIWDSRVQGLGIRVFKSGVKSFFLSYYIEGKKRRATLGRYPEISLADARKLAYERRAQIASGEDPVVQEKIKTMTFEKVLEDFTELYLKRNNKPSTQASTRSLLDNECLSVWKGRMIEDIERKDIIAVLDAMVARGSAGAANNAYAAMSKFFNWCVSRDLIALSPCLGVVRPTKRKTRDRVLSDIELAKVIEVARETSYPFGSIVLLLALTGQRRGEVTKMEWDQIDWEEKTWNLPDYLTKNSKPHKLPLSDYVIKILEDIPRFENISYVFPALGSKITTFSGFGKCKSRLDKEAEVNKWCLHDLRRTLATGMAKKGIPPHIVEKVLNHTSGTISGVAAVYNRFQYIDEMRDALNDWAEHVMSLVGDVQ